MTLFRLCLQSYLHPISQGALTFVKVRWDVFHDQSSVPVAL